MESPALSLIVLRAINIEVSLAFYQALGVTFIQEQHGSGPVHYSCDLGGVILELYPAKAGSSQKVNTDTTMLGFKVTSLASTLAKLNTLGIESKSAPQKSEWGLWVNVIDPSGYTVQISEVVAGIPSQVDALAKGESSP